ncbi:MAG TPA: ABC transporter ATP-binding protein [Chloroflexota bacterium]|nr:ABC transporter ATP-binding protein [Chloroflexota bacterium]
MILIEHLHKTFPGRDGFEEAVVALQDLNLEIRDHEFVTVIGPSGCGKTTLLRIAAGLETADSGRVLIDGKPVTGPGPERAVVFQSFALLPWASVLDNVTFGAEMRGIPRHMRDQRARELVRQVGLAGFEHRLPKQLSGGMQQRVGLARALAVDPDILLMDEPFGSLDEQTRRLLQEQLIRIWEGNRKTVLFITHSMEEAVLLADRLVLLSTRPGRVEEIIDVPLPRPRGPETEKSPTFVEIKEHVWTRLRAMQPDLAA